MCMGIFPEICPQTIIQKLYEKIYSFFFNVEPEPPVEITGENVLFSVSGEVDASSVRAVLFDGDGLFYDAVTPDDTAGKFRVKVPSGDYKAWVVAEADMDADLNALEQGVSTEADFTALAVDRQIADDVSVLW